MKAFDKFSHFKLIHKLRPYSFGCRLIDLINAFLIDRKQRVVIGKNSSSWCDLDSGLPQESVLGPLLFILYINDQPDNLTHKFKLMRDDINKIAKWCKTWYMELTQENFKVMHLEKQTNPADYLIAGKKMGVT